MVQTLRARLFNASGWFGFLAFILASLSLWPALNAEFINYDDPVYVTENAIVRQGITGGGVAWAFSKASAERINLWHPLTWISHMADVSLYGLNARGHHLTSVLLHLACGALLILTIRELARRTSANLPGWLAVLAGLAWATHPCRVEVVAWVSERKEILCAVFTLAAAWGYLASSKRPGLAWVALGIFGLACLSKPVAVALPLALLAFPGARWRRLLPWFGVSLAMGAITLWLQRESGHAVLNAAQTPAYRLLRLPWRALEYVADLAGTPPRVLFRYPPALSWWALILSWAGLLGLAALVWFKRRSWPLFFAGAVWFFAFFLPVSGLVPVSVYETADRYSYLPHMGLLLMLAEGTRRWNVRAVAPAGLAACLAWGAVTWREAGRWRDSLSLFGGEMRINPRSLLAHVQYGHALLEKGNLEEALAFFQKASALDPLAAIGPLNEGLLYERMGKTAEAAGAFRRAAERQTQNGTAHHRLAVILGGEGRNAEALETLKQGLERHPNDLNLLNGLALLYATKLNAPEEAIACYRRAVELAPGHPDLLQGLGATLLRTGKTEEGREYLRRALEADPSRQHLKAYLGGG